MNMATAKTAVMRKARETSVAGRCLFAFDFDHSLIDDNTDTWILGIRPELRLRERLGTLRRQLPCWTDVMNHALMEIHQANCGRADVLETIGRLNFFEQSRKAVKAVSGREDVDSIVISDSNTVFINHILSREGLLDRFDHIFTNPAHFDDDGRLHVQRFHSHTCLRCTRTPNMCKGTILSQFIRDSGGYSRVVYVGDGRGDYCACVALRKTDVVVSREEYSLAQQLNSPSGQEEVKATVHVVNFEQSLGDCIAGLCKAEKK